MEISKCPMGHENIEINKTVERVAFRGKNLEVTIEQYKCADCGIEFASVKQTAATQRNIADTYCKEVGLLTSEQIRKGRKRLNITQVELARRMNVGIASVKRWEGGAIQNKAMNDLLISVLQNKTVGNSFSGNRPLSLARVKLVLKEFEKLLRFPFLQAGEKMLFDAKYAFFADMLSYREHGISLTGGNYAALPAGPQLNNYSDLVDDIRSADLAEAEPLTPEERRIIKRVAMVFPDKYKAINAAHREVVWREKGRGHAIPYTDAFRLTEI